MAHFEQREYVENLKSRYPDYFLNKSVLDIGSLNINGSLRDFFVNCHYTGIDLDSGVGVDIVCSGQDYNAPDQTYDVVCSSECFEHNPYWMETFNNMIRMCKFEGFVFFTCASDGRPEHGTSRSEPNSSPFTAFKWDYYKNLNIQDFTSNINLNDYFSYYGFEYNKKSSDLYFFGIRNNKKISKSEELNLYYNQKNKLNNFPSLNFIGITESENRRKELYQNCEEYNIKNVVPHLYDKYKTGDHEIKVQEWWGNFPAYLGTTTSHLRAIHDWYYGTDEPYAFFCEDDVSFETVKYWNFTWEEFFNKLPQGWECIQLSVMRGNMFLFWQPEVYVRHRCWDDYGCVAYLMTRNHAKRLLDSYYDGKSFNLEYDGQDKYTREGWATLPIIETLIYTNYRDNSVFVFPLFVEDINLGTTVWGDDNKVFEEHQHYHKEITEWWKNKGQYFTLDDYESISNFIINQN